MERLGFLTLEQAQMVKDEARRSRRALGESDDDEEEAGEGGGEWDRERARALGLAGGSVAAAAAAATQARVPHASLGALTLSIVCGRAKRGAWSDLTSRLLCSRAACSQVMEQRHGWAAGGEGAGGEEEEGVVRFDGTRYALPAGRKLLLGVTATPYRMDDTTALACVFEHLAFSIEIATLIRAQHLCKVRTTAARSPTRSPWSIPAGAEARAPTQRAASSQRGGRVGRDPACVRGGAFERARGTVGAGASRAGKHPWLCCA